jgi:hypothetical protein
MQNSPLNHTLLDAQDDTSPLGEGGCGMRGCGVRGCGMCGRSPPGALVLFAFEGDIITTYLNP